MNLSETLLNDVVGLWDEDPERRLAAAESLHRKVSDMADIRSAQPALTVCLSDPDPAVRKAALQTTAYRGELGVDIGLAVPALEALLADPDETIQETAWRALEYADHRLPGILDIVEKRRPEFVFSRATRTSFTPSSLPPPGVEVNPLTEAWGMLPFETVRAAALFSNVLPPETLERHMTEALRKDDDFNAVRAAAYLLACFGIPRVWPGDRRNLVIYLERAVELLQKMIDPERGDPDGEFLEQWNHSPEIVKSVEEQIAVLTRRLAAL